MQYNFSCFRQLINFSLLLYAAPNPKFVLLRLFSLLSIITLEIFPSSKVQAFTYRAYRLKRCINLSSTQIILITLLILLRFLLLDYLFFLESDESCCLCYFSTTFYEVIEVLFYRLSCSAQTQRSWDINALKLRVAVSSGLPGISKGNLLTVGIVDIAPYRQL